MGSLSVLWLLALLVARAGASLQCASGRYPPSGWREGAGLRVPVPERVVDLDLPPERRWLEPLKGQEDNIAHLVTVLKTSLLKLSPHLQLAIELVEARAGGLAATFPPPFDGELVSVARATGLPLADIVVYNIIYEVTAYCTSVVAEDARGVVLHARNLDFGAFWRSAWNDSAHAWPLTEAMRPLVTHYHFQRGGRTVFSMAGFAGYVGVLTAARPGAFSFSVNERQHWSAWIGIFEWLLGSRTDSWMGFLTRDVLENATTYEQAKHMLMTRRMLGTAYFILAGTRPGEGAVVTRDRAHALDVAVLAAPAHWFLVQTNDDRWQEPEDSRRATAATCVQNATRDAVTHARLYDALSTEPVLNSETIATTLLWPRTGRLETYLRYCRTPPPQLHGALPCD